jgi:hypothetical protein
VIDRPVTRRLRRSTLARAECTPELIARLRAVRPDSRARWGRMTAHQMICHLADALRMALGGKSVSAVSGWMPARVIRFLALDVPVRWRPGIPTRPEIDQQHAGTSPGDFAADVAAVEALLDAVASVPRDFQWPRHPIFGPMSYAHWMRWAYLHTDHHLRQFGV